MTVEYVPGYDFSTFKPLTDIKTHKENSPGAYIGPSQVERAWHGGEQKWEQFLLDWRRTAKDQGNENYKGGRSGGYNTDEWYANQLADLYNWRHRQAFQKSQTGFDQMYSQWDARFADYNRRNEQRFADFTSGNDQRWTDAMADWNIEKTYNVGGQQMSTGDAFQHFIDQYGTNRQSISENRANLAAARGDWSKQLGGLHDSLQQQFAAQARLNQGGKTGNATPWKDYQPSGGYSGYKPGFNRDGMRITNLNV